MRIACLVTVCAFVLSSACVGEASLVNGSKREKSESRQMQSRTSTAEGKTNSTAGYQGSLQMQRRTRATTNASVMKRPRRPATTQTSSNQTVQMQQNRRDRPRRHLRRSRSRQSRTSRSFDLDDNQIEEFPVLPSKLMEDGAIYIEPIARVVTKKSLLDSFMDLLKRIFEPSGQKLGPLVGPINFPGLSNKVYVRLLETPEQGTNHVTLRLITREPMPLVEHEASSSVVKDDSFNVVKGGVYNVIKEETFVGAEGDAFGGIKGDAFSVIKGDPFHGVKGDVFDTIPGESFGIVKDDSLHAVLPTTTIIEHVEPLGTHSEHSHLLPTPLTSDENILDAASRHRRLVPHSTRAPYKDLVGQENRNAMRGVQKEPMVERPKTMMKEQSSERLKGPKVQKETIGEDGRKGVIVTGTRVHPWGNMIDAPVRPPLNPQTNKQRYPTYASQIESQRHASREVHQQLDEQGIQGQTRYVTQPSIGGYGGNGGRYGAGHSGRNVGNTVKNNWNKGHGGHSKGIGDAANEATYSAGYGNMGSGVRYSAGNAGDTGHGSGSNVLQENAFQPSPMFQYYSEYPNQYYAESYRQEFVFPNISGVPKRAEAHEPFESFLVRSTINPTVLPVPASSVPTTVQTKSNYYDKSVLRVIAAPNLHSTPTTQATPSHQRRTSPSPPYAQQQKKVDELLQIKAAMEELRKMESPADWQPVSMENKWANAYALSTTTEMSVQRPKINEKISTSAGHDRVAQLKSSNLDNYGEKVEKSKWLAWNPSVEPSVVSKTGSGEENRESMNFEAASLRKKAGLLANENVGSVDEPPQRGKGPIKIVKVVKKPYYPANVTTPGPVATAKPQMKTPAKSAVKTQVKIVVNPTVNPTVKPTVKTTVKPMMKSTITPTVQPTVKSTVKPTALPKTKFTMEPTVKPIKTTTTRLLFTTRPPFTTRLPSTVRLLPTPRFAPTVRSVPTTPKPSKTTKTPLSGGAKSMIHKLFKSTTPRTGFRIPKLKLTTAPSAKAA